MKKESRVYVVDMDKYENTRQARVSKVDQIVGVDDVFMAVAEELGSVYSLKGFEDAVNNEELFLDSSFIFISNK